MTIPEIIFIVFVILWLGSLTYYLLSIKTHFQRLISWDKKGNLKQILEQILERTELDKSRIELLDKGLKELSDKTVGYVQKIGLVRFNPFSDIGGDQSFVLSILDGRDNGVVLTSLHNRGVTRWYVKKVKEGKGIEIELSEEELKSIKLAKNIKK